MPREPDLTGLLQAWSQGNQAALEALAPLVQRELRDIARRILADERRDGRWEPTESCRRSHWSHPGLSGVSAADPVASRVSPSEALRVE